MLIVYIVLAIVGEALYEYYKGEKDFSEIRYTVLGCIGAGVVLYTLFAK